MTAITARRRFMTAAVAASITLALTLTSCGSDSDSDGSGGLDFTIAFPAEPGVQDTPLLATIEDLNDEGWDIKTVVMNDQALQTEALATGQVQMAAGNASTALQAVEKGAKLVILGERSTNDWIVVSQAGIADCAGLAGKKVAYQSEASPSTFMLRTWMEENCPGTEADMLVMEGSANRAAALVAGQIDATVVQVADWVAALGPEGNDGVHELAKLGTSLDKLMASTYVSPESWVDEHDDQLAVFFETLLQHNRDFVDPDAFAEAAVRLLEGLDKESADRIIAAYGSDLFFADGGVTDERVKYTLSFLKETGSLETDLDPAAVVDRGPLDAALAELG